MGTMIVFVALCHRLAARSANAHQADGTARICRTGGWFVQAPLAAEAAVIA
ncbi:hypothetical protein [Caenimonas sedimenti]|uniref:hypothetical protein n=1 Tax=Caenimonas sedimenti TaxID=2596921 RepID=UPI001647EA81|nr:hypothetical protein [Caenimonas sedimenti]